MEKSYDAGLLVVEQKPTRLEELLIAQPLNPIKRLEFRAVKCGELVKKEKKDE